MASKSSKKDKNVIFEQETPQQNTGDDISETKPSAIENIISVALGLAVVFVIGAMIVNVVRNRNSGPATNTDQPSVDQQAASSSGSYTVQAGDTLWSIAEKFYKDGFKYPEIQKANKMTAQSSLEKGMQLIIPTLETTPAAVSPATVATSPAVSMAPETTGAPETTILPSPTKEVLVQGPTGATGGTTQQGETSSASTDRQYTVVKGDSLWSICQKRYGNGDRWVEVARMNNLQNPSIIHAGNVFMMP